MDFDRIFICTWISTGSTDEFDHKLPFSSNWLTTSRRARCSVLTLSDYNFGSIVFHVPENPYSTDLWSNCFYCFEKLAESQYKYSFGHSTR